MVTETIAPADVTYEPPQQMKLKDAQEAARLALIEEHDDNDADCIVETEENQDELADKMACYFHNLEDSSHRVMPESEAIRDLCTIYTRYVQKFREF